MPPRKRSRENSESNPEKGKNQKKKVQKPEFIEIVEEDEKAEDVEGEEGSDDENKAKDLAMSEYERIRLENIRRNEEFLSDLGVSSLRSSLTVSAPKKSSTRRSSPGISKPPPVPTRRSSRVTVEKLTSEIKFLRDSGKLEEAELKQSELNSMIEKQNEGAYVVEPQSLAVEESNQRLLTETVPLSELRGLEEDESSGEIVNELISVMRSQTEAKGKKSTSSKFMEPSPSSFNKLNLHEDDVMRLTPSRITAVALSPSTSTILGVAGDKNGFLGIWNATRGNNNSVYKYRPHISNIINFHFTPEDLTKLYSVSYDGTIRRLDLEREAFSLAFEAPETLREMYFSDGSFSYSQPENVIVSKSSGFVSLIDFRASSTKYQWDFEAQDNRINSVQIHPTQQHLIVTAGGKNGGIAVHDIRKVSKKPKPLSYSSLHSKSINAAYISPDGNYIVSVSLDDSIRVWKNFCGVGDMASNVLKHNNFTGRWLSTFRPSFDPKRANTFVCGSMLQPRRMEIFNIVDSEKSKMHINLLSNLENPLLASVNSRNCFHPNLELVLGSNSSGKVHLFR
jgi:WD40 repeat protein